MDQPMPFEIILPVVAILGIGIYFFTRSKSKKLPPPVDSETKVEVKSETKKEVKEEVKVAPAVASTPKISFTSRLFRGLEKSRQDVWGKIGQMFSSENAALDEVEEILYTADIPTSLVQQLIEKFEKEARGKTPMEISKLVYDFLKSKMSSVQAGAADEIFTFKPQTGPKVIMIVGVNGAGKTTTIGKLATKLQAQGAKVIVGACDTFRAAAVDQLQVWCERAGVDMVRAKDGADPSGVAYDTVARAYSENYDYCLIDTAGRLHTNQNLMEELAKTKRVMSKINEVAPHQVLLVLDAITGQNALKQAQEFHKALNLTGLIFTKCDGSAKAGSAVGIVDQLKVPITYIGVGESVDDLDRFDLDQYLRALTGLEEKA